MLFIDDFKHKILFYFKIQRKYKITKKVFVIKIMLQKITYINRYIKKQKNKKAVSRQPYIQVHDVNQLYSAITSLTLSGVIRP